MNRWEIHKERIQRIELSPDGRWLATGDGSGRILLWDQKQGWGEVGEPLEVAPPSLAEVAARNPEINPGMGPACFAFSGDSTRLAWLHRPHPLTTTDQALIHLLNLSDGTESGTATWKFRSVKADVPMAVAFSRDDRHLQLTALHVMGTHKFAEIFTWDAATLKPLKRGNRPERIKAFDHDPHEVFFSPARTILLGSRMPNLVAKPIGTRFITTGTYSPILTLGFPYLVQTDGLFAFSPDDRLLATIEHPPGKSHVGTEGAYTIIRDLGTGTIVTQFAPLRASQGTFSLALSPDLKYLATAAWYRGPEDSLGSDQIILWTIPDLPPLTRKGNQGP